MIKTLIIEDEWPAAQRLGKLLKGAEPEIEITAIIDSVEAAVRWLNSNRNPDLIILDIQLADGLSFDIFSKVQVESFVIFTTAYDEYAIRAFELNSIDYLLKPVDPVKLQQSIAKFKRIRPSLPNLNLNAIIEQIGSGSSKFKKRFAISLGAKIVIVETTDIALFYSLEKNTFLVSTNGQNYPVDFSLEKIESLLNPEEFFRISRQYLIAYNSILKIHVLSKSRIELSMKGISEHVQVSSPKTHAFRLWIDK